MSPFLETLTLRDHKALVTQGVSSSSPHILHLVRVSGNGGGEEAAGPLLAPDSCPATLSLITVATSRLRSSGEEDQECTWKMLAP